MTNSTSPFHPKSLLDIARNLYHDDEHLRANDIDNAAYTWLWRWGRLLLFVAMIALVAVAPVLLLLLFVGVNYTDRWITYMLWLFGVSFVYGGVIAVAEGYIRVRRGEKQGFKELLFGISILIGVVSAWVLLFNGWSGDRNPFVSLGATGSFAIIAIGWGLVHLLSAKNALIFRLAFFAGTVCFASGVVAGNLGLNREFYGLAEATVDRLRFIGSLAVPLGLAFHYISRIGDWKTEGRWNRRAILYLCVNLAILALILFVVLT